MALKRWNKLGPHLRRSEGDRWNYLVDELSSGDETPKPEPQEPVQQEEPPVTRDISITVNDGTDAVEGASVAIGEITGTTGSDGGCTLQGVADGEQTINVTATGFDDYSDTITVSENGTSFTISLTAATPGEQQETPGQ